jgi:hypothetical protein
MISKDYFESVRNASLRADALQSLADTTAEYAGAAKGVRYDRAECGTQKGGYKSVDGILNTVERLDAARDRALSAREYALSLVAEATAIIERAMESPDADIPCLTAVYKYYVVGKDEATIAAEEYAERSRIAHRKRRGLAKLEPFVPR